MAALREAELRRALDVAGADLLPILGHPDGGCAEVPHEHGVAQVRAALDAVRPHVVVTFGPDGITGHPDHLAVQRWVTDAWRQVRQGALLYATMTDDFVARNRALHDRVGVFGDHEPVSVPDAGGRPPDRARRLRARPEAPGPGRPRQPDRGAGRGDG